MYLYNYDKITNPSKVHVKDIVIKGHHFFLRWFVLFLTNRGFLSREFMSRLYPLKVDFFRRVMKIYWFPSTFLPHYFPLLFRFLIEFILLIINYFWIVTIRLPFIGLLFLGLFEFVFANFRDDRSEEVHHASCPTHVHFALGILLKS